MKPLTSEVVYRLAQLTEYLRHVKGYDAIVFQDGSYEKFGQKLIVWSMRDLVSQLQLHSLVKQDCEALSALCKDFQNKYGIGKTNIEDEDAKKLTLIIERIEASLKQEISRRNFTELTPVDGMLNYNKLLPEGLSSLLASESLFRIHLTVLSDLEEAIKCLSYGAPTASVMIGLRAVEGILRQVHTNLTGKESKKMWKQLIEDIQADLKDKGVDESPLFGYLDYVRGVRNQADHPGRNFTQLEAEQLFMHAIHIITEVDRLGGTTQSTT